MILCRSTEAENTGCRNVEGDTVMNVGDGILKFEGKR